MSGIFVGPGCVVERRAGRVSRGKRLPAARRNMSWFQGKQLEVRRSILVLDYILINSDQTV